MPVGKEEPVKQKDPVATLTDESVKQPFSSESMKASQTEAEALPKKAWKPVDLNTDEKRTQVRERFS